MAKNEKKRVCGLSGAEIVGEPVMLASKMIDKDTKVELRVYKRTGSNTFLQAVLSKSSAAKLQGILDTLDQVVAVKGGKA